MTNIKASLIKKGAIFYANLNPIIGSEQGGARPVLIVSSDIGNSTSPTVIVAIISSHTKKDMSIHCSIKSNKLSKRSIVMLEQFRTIDKKRLLAFMDNVSKKEMKLIEKKLLISLDIRTNKVEGRNKK